MRLFSSGSYLPFLCKLREKFSFVLSTNMAAMQPIHSGGSTVMVTGDKPLCV